MPQSSICGEKKGGAETSAYTYRKERDDLDHVDTDEKGGNKRGSDTSFIRFTKRKKTGEDRIDRFGRKKSRERNAGPRRKEGQCEGSWGLRRSNRGEEEKKEIITPHGRRTRKPFLLR